MNRRLFLGAVSSPLLAQVPGTPVNDDRASHLSNMDQASMASMAAGAPGRSIPVPTRGYNNLRSGANTQETVLTPEALRQNPLRKLFGVSLPGDARGMEAQPLFVPQVTAVDGQTHNLMLSATMGNQIYCHDADDGTPLWMVLTGRPVAGSRDIDYWSINPHFGTMSTPVVDRGVLYALSAISSDGTPAREAHWLVAIDIAKGTVLRRLQITQQAALQRKQRAALSLATVAGRRTIFIPFGTVQETAAGAHGFITAVDVDRFAIAAELNITPTGFGGGIWQAGAGMIADDQGYLYAMTGNGTYDGASNFGESFIRVQYDGTSLKIVDHYSPFRDSARPAAYSDQDLGSGGPSLIPELGLVFGAGKDAVLYTLPWRAMAKPALPPIWWTFFPGNGVSPTDLNNLNKQWFGRTHHQHSTSPVWKSTAGWRTYCWGENAPLRAWSVDAGGCHYLATGNEYASAQSPVSANQAGGMPGAMMTLSANGDRDGIVWATVPDFDANKIISTGRLLAYDALNYINGNLQLLWRSEEIVFNKFLSPVVNGGRVYVGTYDAQILTFGL